MKSKSPQKSGSSDNSNKSEEMSVFLNRFNRNAGTNDKSQSKNESVTTFLKKFFETFNPHTAIKEILKSDKMNDPTYEYYGKNKREIMALWRETAVLGTKLHKQIENYFNGESVEDEDTIEYRYFMNFIRDHPDITFHASEFKIKSDKLKLSGYIDMVCKNSNGNYTLLDWKRCKHIDTQSYKGTMLKTKGLEHIHDCNLSQYTFQLNIYKYILEHDYEMVVDDMILVVFYPSNSDYIKYEIEDLNEEMDIIMNERLRNLEIENLKLEIKSEESVNEESCKLENKILPLSDVDFEAREKNISINEETHLYNVSGEDFDSITIFLKYFFERFDEQRAVNSVLNSRKMENPDYEYYGMDKQAIIDKWQESAILSTSLYKQIENYFKDKEQLQQLQEIEENIDSIELSYFKNFMNDHSHYNKFKTEMKIYHNDLKLAGSVDMICVKDNGHYMLFDWKRSKRIDKTSFRDKRSTFPGLEHIPDSNFYHYSFQLNIYKFILQTEYGMIIDDMFLIVFHPSNENYIKYEVNDMTKEMVTVVNHRAEIISDSGIV